MITGTLQAIRTTLPIPGILEKSRFVEVGFEISKGLFSLTDGAITGFESFVIAQAKINTIREHGWCANMGTAGSWDKLYIPAEEMRRALDMQAVEQLQDERGRFLNPFDNWDIQ